MLSLGIDIGGKSVKVAAQQEGQVLWNGQSPFYSRPNTAELLQAVRSAIGGRLAGRSPQRVGLCVPGLLDRDRRMITLSVNVPGLMNIVLDELVNEALGVQIGHPVAILNDAVASAHDLYRRRGIAGRLLVIALGTGVGAAVLDDGVPLHVEGASPGHVGQFDVAIAGEDVLGPDGGAGGLEGYIGAAALARRYGEDVSAALARFTGDEPAICALARAVRICHAIYRPHHIVLSGGIGTRLRHVLPVLRRRVGDRLTSIAREGWSLTCGDDDHHAARGAALIAAGSK